MLILDWEFTWSLASALEPPEAIRACVYVFVLYLDKVCVVSR